MRLGGIGFAVLSVLTFANVNMYPHVVSTHIGQVGLSFLYLGETDGFNWVDALACGGVQKCGLVTGT